MPKPTAQIFLAFDFGMRRIGVAVGQVVTKTAKPLDTLKAIDGVPQWEEIEILIKRWHVDGFVVGIPYNMDGTEQPITQIVRAFVKKLSGRFKLPIHLMDERLTTQEAKWHIRDMKRKKDAQVDSIAAAIILESWLAQSNNSRGV